MHVHDATNIATLIVSVILYGSLLVFAIGCLLFNILFRSKRYISLCFLTLSFLLTYRVVKLTSPTLNCVMIAGAIVLGSFIVLQTVPVYSMDVLPPLCIVSYACISSTTIIIVYI